MLKRLPCFRKKQSQHWSWVILGLLWSSLALGQSPYQYRAQVRKAALSVHKAHPYTFFCQFPYHPNRDIEMPLHTILPARSRKVAWMPIVPLPRLGEHLACWHSRCQIQGKIRQGSICCTSGKPRFREAEGDLHNLVPVAPQWIKWRGDRDFGDTGESSATECGVGESQGIISPPAMVKGTVARAYLYMRDSYQVPLNEAQVLLYLSWHLAYPPEAWEREWNLRVTQLQGRTNPYIENERL